jgi:DnaK suppressor protein
MEVYPLSKSQLETLRTQILKERELNLNFMPEISFGGEGDKDSVDIANSEVLGEVTTTLKRRLIEKERKFQEALLKISRSSYGVCEDCGGFIGFNRLLRYPSANLCILCKEDAERGK